MATQSFQLVMRAGPSIGKVYPISKAEMHAGRDISNEIVINDAEVSRKHLRLVLQAGEVIVEDLGSTNGTFVNDQRVSGPFVLSPSDTLQLGEHVVLVFEAALQQADATVAVSPSDALKTEFDAEATPMPLPPPVEAYEPPPMPAVADPPLNEPLYASTPVEPPKDNRRTYILVGVGCLVLFCLCVVVPVAVASFFDLQTLFGF
jgi:pSer/pThr/pTyr-binding forkhead associated (FHA) protein